MSKKIIFIILGVLLVAVGAITITYYISLSKDKESLPGSDAKATTLVCSNGYSAKATFYGVNKSGVMEKLLLVVAKGEDINQHLMTQTVSVSGAKFATQDGTVSIWEHQGEFSLEESGVPVAICRDEQKQTFTLEGSPVTLTAGLLEKEIAPGSVAKEIIRYFGDEAVGDINGDGKVDKVFFVTKETGGSGVFFYVVGMLATDTLPKGTQAVAIGDRIAPQSLEIRDGVVLVNYAERKPDEPFTSQPSVAKTVRLKLDPIALDFGEVVVNFEGEADPTKMTLFMKEWKWVKTTYNNDKEVFPIKKDVFLTIFTKEGNVLFKTDCNTMSAEYTISGDTISFGPITSTEMFCEGSQQDDFTKMVQDTERYMFTSRGELIILLKMDSGSIMFK